MQSRTTGRSRTSTPLYRRRSWRQTPAGDPNGDGGFCSRPGNTSQGNGAFEPCSGVFRGRRSSHAQRGTSQPCMLHLCVASNQEVFRPFLFVLTNCATRLNRVYTFAWLAKGCIGLKRAGGTLHSRTRIHKFYFAGNVQRSIPFPQRHASHAMGRAGGCRSTFFCPHPPSPCSQRAANYKHMWTWGEL